MVGMHSARCQRWMGGQRLGPERTVTGCLRNGADAAVMQKISTYRMTCQANRREPSRLRRALVIVFMRAGWRDEAVNQERRKLLPAKADDVFRGDNRA